MMYEELLRYLRHISRTWKGILEAARISPDTVDHTTVERLELLAPSISNTDRKLVEEFVRSRQVFETVTSEPARARITITLTSIPGLIPSLRSFFENLKYLEPCCNILKKLFSADEKRSIYQALSAAYFAPREYPVEFSERRNRPAQTGANDKEGNWLAYVQLWAFCMRHFPSMTQITPRKETGKKKPSTRPNSALWHHLGDLAVRLGFRTDEALAFQKEDPHRCLAEQLLKSLRPYSVTDESIVTQVAIALKKVDGESGEDKWPKLTRDQYLPTERRCNRPFEDDFEEDRQSLFVPLIYKTETPEGTEISSFFVQKDIFVNFLGNEYPEVSNYPPN